ncbi:MULTISPECIES: hypothetical protein [unclassified Nitrosomonas]|jgi:predicted small lipoprotein YifL|nr:MULTISPECIES: hypothetical protein [unclassified Nitrosomonas]SDI16964.1 hypothetical protein SAMN05428952_11025 [Nitrosomonas sp. Nm132]SDZ19889.1 hypothetical protein SAMN05421754_10931 [Nitrosomonas sp. Nm58]
MKSAFLVAILTALTLTACGDPKPAQYPPSASMERESMPDKADETKK